MRAYIDLHIHSGLSPCSDKDMTPNNIVNMAYIKGLDIIAVTDHNSAENCEAVLQCAKERGLVAVPGMELETSEEVHVVCLFPDLRTALQMQALVYNKLPALENREEIFGEQLLMDAEDNVTGHLKQLLLTAAAISIDDVCEIAGKLGAVVIPAHVDRESYSLISNLGAVPQALGFKYLEISKECNAAEFVSNTPGLNRYGIIRSSDAHRLEDILERESSMELDEISVRGLLDALKKGMNGGT